MIKDVRSGGNMAVGTRKGGRAGGREKERGGPRARTFNKGWK